MRWDLFARRTLNGDRTRLNSPRVSAELAQIRRRRLRTERRIAELRNALRMESRG